MISTTTKPTEKSAPIQMKSVGILVKRSDNGEVRFVFKNKKVISDLDQLGFSLDILKVEHGSISLPALSSHVDNQASLEAYWSAQAEEARFKYNVVQDSFNFWYESKYSLCFNILQNSGVPKPIQKEVEAKISRKFGDELRKKKEHLRTIEYHYRMLANACYSSVVAKGKMLQTLRNIIQGNGASKFGIGTEVEETDLGNMVVES